MKKSYIERYRDFMSTDWLPKNAEGARIIPSHVYTEPRWTRTIKGVLVDRRATVKHLYDIFDLYKEGAVILAEGYYVLFIMQSVT